MRDGNKDSDSRSPNSRRLLLPICYLGFISLGLPDTVIGVAWPSIRKTFGLQQSDISWIFVGSGCSYFLSSFFAGRLLRVFNVGVLLALSSGLVALGGFNFSGATIWPWFALGSLLHGLGSGAIDSGLNHYVASHFSARHMNWLHASYSLGAMLGPMIMTACIARDDRWRFGYFIVALALFTLSIVFFCTQTQWKDGGKESAQHNVHSEEAGKSKVSHQLAESLHEPPNLPIQDADGCELEDAPGGKVLTVRFAICQPLVQIQIVLFFLYTGLEVALGQWSFTVLKESRGLEPKTAGVFVTLYWASILAGRIIFGFIVEHIGIDALIRASLLAAVTGTALFAWNPHPGVDAPSLVLSGLGLAVIFPCLMTRTPQRLGKNLAAHAIGFQVGGAMLGAATLPSLCGVVAQRASLSLVAPMFFGFAVAIFALHELLLSLARASNRGKTPSS